MIVVDASVAAKWLLEEAGSDHARDLLAGGEELIAPDLIRVEVAAAVTRRVRMRQIDTTNAAAIIDSWTARLEEGALRLIDAAHDLSMAARLAMAIEHPLQDCLYLALAIRTESSLITADRAFISRSARYHRYVKLLGAD